MAKHEKNLFKIEYFIKLNIKNIFIIKYFINLSIQLILCCETH